MKEGKIVKKLFIEKNGEMAEVVIRYSKKSDLKEIWKFYNQVIKETEFLSRIRSVPLKEERKWLDNILKGMRKGNKIHLLAECNGKIVGSTSVERQEEDVHKHVGVYGIAILQKYTGCGLGTKLTELVLELAKAMNLEIVRLSVYGKNRIAQRLYRKLGFKGAGKIKMGTKRGRKYDDEIIMYKVLK